MWTQEKPAPPEPHAAPPRATVARAGNALRLAAVDARAAALGLAAGMTLADARARVPTLATQAHDPEGDARALDWLAARMGRFTPLVALDPPDGLIFDITGAAHLFGGEAALVVAVLGEAGLTTRHALAGNAAAVRVLARYGGDDVLALPVAALELGEAAQIALRRAGLKRLGDLACRPMPALAARFGADAVERLRRILGEAASPITPRPPPRPIRAEMRFAEPIARVEDVVEAIEALLAEACAQMEARRLGARAFAVRLDRADGARRRLTVETGAATRDGARVMRLLRERIDTLADPLDPGFGFDSVALAAGRCEPLAARQGELAGGEADEDGALALLIDRLATRLGPENVARLAPRDSHIPERAQALVPAHAARAGAAVPWLTPDTAPRPLLLFTPPQPITAIASLPDSPPARFFWRGRAHEVVRAEGPERIAPEWWRRRDGHLPGRLRARDYYRVEDGAGRRFWLFRHGLYEECGDPDWYLHGLFA